VRVCQFNFSLLYPVLCLDPQSYTFPTSADGADSSFGFSSSVALVHPSTHFYCGDELKN
jgi:hypothetical protein